MRAVTAKVYSSLGMRGVVRFDYLLSGSELFLSEVNTVPGSMAWYLFADSFARFRPVLEAVTEQAVADDAELRGKLVLKTGILNAVPDSVGKLKRK